MAFKVSMKLYNCTVYLFTKIILQFFLIVIKQEPTSNHVHEKALVYSHCKCIIVTMFCLFWKKAKRPSVVLYLYRTRNNSVMLASNVIQVVTRLAHVPWGVSSSVKNCVASSADSASSGHNASERETRTMKQTHIPSTLTKIIISVLSFLQIFFTQTFRKQVSVSHFNKPHTHTHTHTHTHKECLLRVAI